MIYRLLLILFLLHVNFLCLAKNHVISLNIQPSGGYITLSPQLYFSASNEIKEAIDSGIRVQLIAKAQLFQPKTWWFDNTIANKKINLEISYFTLGKLYIIKNKTSGEQLGFNDYKQLWKGMEPLLSFKFKHNDKTDLWAKLRIVLDKKALPTVMQLPIIFNSNWDIDTPWHQQVVEPQ